MISIEERLNNMRMRLRFAHQEIEGLRNEIGRLRTEFSRFIEICGEGSSRGRAVDLIAKRDLERARKALQP